MATTRVRGPIIHSAICAVLATAGFTCSSSSKLPGTSLGTFSVTGSLTSNSCGSGIGASNPWNFSVELSKDGTTLYMAETDGSNEMSSTLSSKTADLSSTVTTNVDGTDAALGTCNLTSTETFDITLSSTSSPVSFTGTATYEYSVATTISTTTNCADQLASSGGTYSTLPCSVVYSLKATRQ